MESLENSLHKIPDESVSLHRIEKLLEFKFLPYYSMDTKIFAITDWARLYLGIYKLIGGKPYSSKYQKWIWGGKKKDLMEKVEGILEIQFGHLPRLSKGRCLQKYDWFIMAERINWIYQARKRK